MDEKMYRYHLNCEFLWYVLSAADLLLEDVDSFILNQRFRTGYDEFEDLAGWLRNELSWVVGRPGVSEEEAKGLQTAMGTLTNQLDAEWREKVYELAKEGLSS